MKKLSDCRVLLVDDAKMNGWMVISMKDDWNAIFPAAK